MSSYSDRANFNVYTDDVTAERLKRLARKTGATRNALVRKAIAVYLDRGTSEWPALVSEYEDARTHMRYVDLVQRGALPVLEAALPQGVPASPLLKLPDCAKPLEDEEASFLRRPQRESNSRYRRERPMS